MIIGKCHLLPNDNPSDLSRNCGCDVSFMDRKVSEHSCSRYAQLAVSPTKVNNRNQKNDHKDDQFRSFKTDHLILLFRRVPLARAA